MKRNGNGSINKTLLMIVTVISIGLSCVIPLSHLGWALGTIGAISLVALFLQLTQEGEHQ